MSLDVANLILTESDNAANKTNTRRALCRVASMASKIVNTRTSPYSYIVKLYQCYGNSCYVCSGVMVGEYHVLTAAHCIHNITLSGWATNVLVVPGQTDNIWPYVSDRFWYDDSAELDPPYGLAWVTRMKSTTGWTGMTAYDQKHFCESSSRIRYDYAVLELDRPLGRRTSWIGYSSQNIPSSLNLLGYPAETCSGLFQYSRFYTTSSVSDTTFRVDGLTEGGDSGGTAYRFDPTTSYRYAQGISSCSDRATFGIYVRIDGALFNRINDWVSNSETIPALKPQLIEYTSGTKSVSPTFASRGQTISITATILNIGFASCSDIALDYYLSTDNDVAYDDYLGSSSTSLDAYTFIEITSSVTIPDSARLGDRNVLISFSCSGQYDTLLDVINAGIVTISSASTSTSVRKDVLLWVIFLVRTLY